MEQTISEYSSMSKEEFKELILIGRLKTRFELAYFILNTLHHIVNSGGWYCHCHHFEEGRKYKFFSIPMIFKDFEKDIERNIFDVNFLFNYYTKLCHELLELFDKKKNGIECFQAGYEFSGTDWNTGEYWSVPLSENIQYNEKILAALLKKEKLPIPPKYQDQKTDLSYRDF